jgi:uncharacterized membrane protein
MLRSRPKRLSCYVIAFVFVAARVLHFTRPAMYAAIMPPYIPYASIVNRTNGAFSDFFP